ncbi:MAG: RHS repeat protein, partial [Comamonadaceae bacterium]
MQRVYRSGRVGGAAPTFGLISGDAGVASGLFPQSTPVMGHGWSSMLEARLYVAQSERSSSASPYWLGWVTVSLGNGKYRIFKYTDTGFKPLSAGTDRLWKTTPGAPDTTATEYIYQADGSDTQYVFGFNSGQTISTTAGYPGHLQQIKDRNGWITQFVSDPTAPPDTPRPRQIVNAFGHSLALGYTASGQLSQVQHISPNGLQLAAVNYHYDTSSRLVQIEFADGTYHTLHYENLGNSRWLTGYSVNGTRVETYRYDSEGRAIESTRAAGADRYLVDYSQSLVSPTTSTFEWVSVTDPLGTPRSYRYSASRGRISVLVASALPNNDSLSPTASRSTDVNGLVVAETDFQGVARTSQYDPVLQLPTVVTEAAGKPEERTTNTTWHPQWRLPLTVIEADRTTTYTYDSVGNRLSQTITDTGAGSTARTTSWTYHPSGLVATETAPNGGVTSYQYSSAGHLTSTTNALGHTDTYTHDAAGRVLTHTTPAGLVASYTYDARGRVLTTQTGGQTTIFTYRPSGQIATATLPTGHVTTYTYDAAQRLTGWSDNRGHSGTYTLDAMGNRTQEAVRNAQGQTAWSLARSINNLNRVASTTVGGQQTTSYGYDANGEANRTTNGLNQSTQLGLDALRRVKT